MNIYESKHYKKLLIVPVIAGIICLFFVTQIRFGLDFKGGTLITAPTPAYVDAENLKIEMLAEFDLEDLDVRTTTGIMTEINVQFTGETTLLQAQALLEAKDYTGSIELSKEFTGTLNVSGDDETVATTYFSGAREIFKNSIVMFVAEKTGAKPEEMATDEVGPSFGALFWEQGKNALILAFVLIAILIFYFFRTPIVAFAVIQASFFDVLFGAAVLGLLGIPLTLATVAALLMLIGYSIDTDIMLTDRVLRRKEGTPGRRAREAMNTGLTMTGTTLGALIGLFVVSSMAGIALLSSISIVLIAGLVGDLISTWCTNATLDVWYMERKAKKYKQ